MGVSNAGPKARRYKAEIAERDGHVDMLPRSLITTACIIRLYPSTRQQSAPAASHKRWKIIGEIARVALFRRPARRHYHRRLAGRRAAAASSAAASAYHGCHVVFDHVVDLQHRPKRCVCCVWETRVRCDRARSRPPQSPRNKQRSGRQWTEWSGKSRRPTGGQFRAGRWPQRWKSTGESRK